MSEKQKHTPGPWKVNETVQMTSSVYIFADRNFACVYDEWQDRGIMEANARLIAAAPDLLAALKAAVACRIDGNWYEQSKAAIAKAEGKA